MAYDSRSVANEFLRLANNAGRTLTNMQVQKLVYIAHGYSLAILNKPLIDDRVEAWRYGPVIRPLYDSLRQYGAGVVSEPIKDAPKESTSETDRALIARVLNAYGRYSGNQLSTITHREDGPWREIYQPNAFFNNDTIPDDVIKRHYQKLLHERAEIKPA